MGLGLQLMVAAGLFVALTNLCMRRSIGAGGSSNAYLVIQLFLTFIVAILLNPVRTGIYAWDPSMAVLGLSGGVLLAGMFGSIGKALETGPSGLTFAMLNSATVMPALFMVLLFGSIYTPWNAAGSALVVIGLFWAGWQTIKAGAMNRWAFFAFAAFAFHILFLLFMQWRVHAMQFPGKSIFGLSFSQEALKTQWFMPMLFLAAFSIQLVRYWLTEKRAPNAAEVKYGVLGGLSNGVGTFLMILSTEMSTSMEQAMIFPIFSVTIVILCNLWGQWLYKERIHWRANAFCVAGVLIGTLDWNSLLK